MTITTGHSKKQGFTLVEMLISMTIGAIALSIGLGSIMFLSRGMVGLINYADMNTASRSALEVFSRDIRMGSHVQASTVDYLAFNVDKRDGSSDFVVYEYVDQEGVLYRKFNANPRTALLKEIDEMEMRYFTLRRNPTSKPLEVKEVQFEIIMEKQALQITNTNHIISAQFMMRNRTVSN